MTAVDLRLGRWQDVLADVDGVDAIICDPPYGARTHTGHDVVVEHLGAANNVRRKSERRAIDYAPMTTLDVFDFVQMWAPRLRGWFLAMTSHDLVGAYGDVLTREGFYVFAPLPFVSPGSRVRLSGDGPSSWTCWIVVARPRERRFMSWGTLPGAYVCPPESCEVVGGKPLALMRALVRDYSRPGDMVCDPFAGSGTTALACLTEGRRFVGAEQKPEHHAIAMARIARGVTVDMFAGSAA